MKDKDGTIETLERQVIQKKIDVEVLRVGTEFKKDLLETKSALDDLQNKVKVDAEYERKKVKDDVAKASEKKKVEKK